jgi:hypothetical protein
MMSECYPENWKHAVIHFNPETKSIHFDRHFDSCSDEDIEIISGYWEGLKSENKWLREAIEKSLTILPSCAADCKKPIKEALEGGGNDA